MEIGIIGVSSLTLALASRSAEAGYKVKIYNPRGNYLIRDVAQKMGPNVQLSALEESADTGLVLLFIPKDDLERILQTLPDMSGKIIIHTSSLIFDPRKLLSSITNALTYQITAALVPEAHVVKLFNPVDLKTKNSCIDCSHKDEIFFMADHRGSRNHVRDFLKKINFSPIDLSSNLRLRNAAFNLKSIMNPIKSNLNKSLV
ncbi:NAD(P)-binding domain-containing protein [Flavobacterium sp. 3-210]